MVQRATLESVIGNDVSISDIYIMIDRFVGLPVFK